MLPPLVQRAALGLLMAMPAAAQTYTGTHAAQNDRGGQTIVTLRQTGDSVTGSIVGNGATFLLAGVLDDGSIAGTVAGAPGGGLWFEAEMDEGTLYLTLIGAGADGRPDYEQTSTLVFVPQGGVPQGGAAAVGQTGASALAGAAANPPAAADPWVGTFSDGTLVLQLQGAGAGGEYAGWVELGGQRFPLAARGSGASLTGSFRTGDGEFPVALQHGGGVVTVTSGGMTYTLQRGGAAAANPLAGGGVAGTGPAAASTGGRGGALDDGTPLGREWSQFLAGKKATKMSSYSSGSAGGYNSRTDVHLCANGQFGRNSNSLVAVDVGDAGGYSGSRGGGQGTWRIITQGNVAGIELRYATGEVEQHRLDFQESKTYVDGERWLVTPSEVCGGG